MVIKRVTRDKPSKFLNLTIILLLLSKDKFKFLVLKSLFFFVLKENSLNSTLNFLYYCVDVFRQCFFKICHLFKDFIFFKMIIFLVLSSKKLFVQGCNSLSYFIHRLFARVQKVTISNVKVILVNSK